MGPLNIKKSLS